MPHYPQQNFNAMRQDAIRRSREMQRRAAPSPPAEHSPSASQINAAHSQAIAPLKQNETMQNNLLSSELQNLLRGWDGERIALLGLLYILYKEGADAKLLLAIAYILL